MHTLHRDTRDVRSSPLSLDKVCGCCVSNCLLWSIVVNQKLYLSGKKWQVPLAPWHSMNGFGLKDSRHEPDDERD